jgi:HEAT repeat protein
MNPDGSITLVAWLLPSGARVPERWTVFALKDRPVAINYVSAYEILLNEAGSVEAMATKTTQRALRFLESGTNDDRLWALQHICETGNRSAVPDLLALLANRSAGASVRLLTATTLGCFAESATIATLADILHSDPAREVRRACAQAIGHIKSNDAVRFLSEAASNELDVTVRAEIVHALILQGAASRDALQRIALHDTDSNLRHLARGRLGAFDLTDNER